MLEIEIENFGPIRKIESPDNRMRINDLTLFIGPSNTGKSLLMKLLYAITDSINDAVKDHIISPFLTSSPHVRNYILDVLINLGTENIQEILIDKDKLENFLYNYLNEILKDTKKEVETKIRRIFYPEIIKGKVRII
ncbi:MAG: ATP-binding protein, partial [Crenarchaeota archaeon]|nr:ATP-binding protein [Thermoproteota archaeon]